MFKEKIKNIDKKLCLVLLIAFLMRFIGSWDIPTMNVDEGYSFYSAKCLLQYGQDIWGHNLPVYSEAWGSGMSMGYIYLSIPFMFLFGTNILAYRLPMILGGVISTFFMYEIGNLKNKNTGHIMSLIYATIPWTVMQQRWGLDCNLFLILFIIGMYYMLEYLLNDKKKSLYISLIIFGFSLYGYALAYLYVPIYLLIIVVILLSKKQFKLKDWLIPCIILGIIALPLMVFVLDHVLELNYTKFLIFDLPILTKFRSSEIGFSIDNVMRFIDLFVFQTDYFTSNTFISSGLMYYITTPLILLGTALLFIEKNDNFNDWMIVMFLATLIPALFLIKYGNANKIMLITIFASYFISLSTQYLSKLNLGKLTKVLPMLLLSIYALTVSMFFSSYLLNQNSYLSERQYTNAPELAPYGMIDVAKYAEENYPGENKYLYCSEHFSSSLLLSEFDVDPTSSTDYLEKHYYTKDGKEVFYKDFARVKNFYIFSKIEDGQLKFAGQGETVAKLENSLVISNCNMTSMQGKELLFRSKQYCLFK